MSAGDFLYQLNKGTSGLFFYTGLLLSALISLYQCRKSVQACTHVHTHTHTRTHTHTHSLTHTHTQIYIYIFNSTHAHRYIHAQIYIHAHTYAHGHTQINIHTQSTNTHKPKYTRSQIYTNAQTNTYTHSQNGGGEDYACMCMGARPCYQLVHILTSYDSKSLHCNDVTTS